MRDFKNLDPKAVARKMRDINFTALSTHAADGSLRSQPMSNDGKVEHHGDLYYFTWDAVAHGGTVTDVEADARVGMLIQGRHRNLGLAMIKVNETCIDYRDGENKAKVPNSPCTHQGGER